ncbi:MAG: hypothetical protein H6Q90_4883 [Deltaproteobacteria bacterium]|nr:hypothetical protein [Deltaproteobacteria bacterium]
MDPRLVIVTPRIQNQASELVRLSLRALDHLTQLDEGLYERFVASQGVAVDPAAHAASLRRLWDHTFGGLLELLTFCRSLVEDVPQEPAGEMPSFDFGELEEGAGTDTATELDLGSSDIGDLLEGIDEHVEEGDAERWKDVLDKVASIAYGLRSQHVDATARLNVALGAREIGQVLGLLDDTQSAASEGVHALVTAVYQEFAPDVDPAAVVPGYTTSLGRALLVRRGLADLAARLAPHNDALQGADKSRHPRALDAIRDTMNGFVMSVVCRAMRAADRWQMVEFENALADEPVAAARQTSEGLVKYLDSLGSISQREVLVLHDQRVFEEMRELLAGARQLVELSPRTANEMLERAYQAAKGLLGRRPDSDQLIGRLGTPPTSADRDESLRFLESLEALLEHG